MMKKKVNRKEAKVNKLSGIAGWLIALTIFIFILAFYFSGFTLLVLLFSLSKNVTAIGIITFLLFGISAFLYIYSIILEFKKRKRFRIFVSISFFMGIIAFILSNGISAILSFQVILSIISLFYISFSKRVKNTFVK